MIICADAHETYERVLSETSDARRLVRESATSPGPLKRQHSHGNTTKLTDAGSAVAFDRTNAGAAVDD